MISAIIILFELLLLYLLSNRLTKTLYSILHFFLRSKHAVMAIITFIYLPGTAVHELAHLIVAEILRVPTGKLSFAPEIEKNQADKQELKAGSLKIAKTDPLRRYLIGFAPVLIGLMVLALLIWLFQYYWPQMTLIKNQIVLISIISYLIFAVSNNMFSSKKDLEGFLIVLPVIILVIVAAYVAGVRISLSGKALTLTHTILTGLARSLGIVILVNVTILLFGSLLLHLLNKLRQLVIK